MGYPEVFLRTVSETEELATHIDVCDARCCFMVCWFWGFFEKKLSEVYFL